MRKDLKPLLEKAKKCYELKELERLGLTPDMDQREQILSFISLILKNNKELSLIPEKDVDKMFIRHFCDSLQPLLLFGFKKNATVFDIGSGGGFPVIPTLIFRPDLAVTCCESNRKKVALLEEIKKELMLENLVIINKKAEKIDPPENGYDYVMSRGLSTLMKISELSKPFVAKDGYIYSYKTKNFESELSKITITKIENGIGISEIAEYDLGNHVFGLNLVSLELL